MQVNAMWTMLGALLIIAGIATVVYQTAKSWSLRRKGLKSAEAQQAKISPPGVALVAAGAIMIAIGTLWP